MVCQAEASPVSCGYYYPPLQGRCTYATHLLRRSFHGQRRQGLQGNLVVQPTAAAILPTDSKRRATLILPSVQWCRRNRPAQPLPSPFRILRSRPPRATSPPSSAPSAASAGRPVLARLPPPRWSGRSVTSASKPWGAPASIAPELQARHRPPPRQPAPPLVAHRLRRLPRPRPQSAPTIRLRTPSTRLLPRQAFGIEQASRARARTLPARFRLLLYRR